MFQLARPFFQSVAVSAAYASRLSPFRDASPSSTHGRKSEGWRSGNVSRRLPMSPLGSMMRAGIPASSASSRAMIPRPVLPDPVMPTMTPWVVNRWLS